MTGELDKVSELVRQLDGGQRKAFGELSNELRRQHEGIDRAVASTPSSSARRSRARRRAASGASAWPKTCCGSPASSKASTTASRRRSSNAGRPDYTFLMPNGLVMHMDVKFPLDNYVRHLEADQRPRAQAVPRPVPPRRPRPREGAHDRGYLDATDETVDCLLLFIPNEQVYAFVQENDRAILDDAHAQQDRRVLAAHAVRGARGRAPGGRQLPARAHVERDPRRCSASSRGSGRSTSAQLEKVQQRFEQRRARSTRR